MSRKQYVESELEKLREKYEVPYEKEFSLKALFGLQHQFHATPDEHIRTKTDILNAISGLEKGLHLSKKIKLDNPIKLLIRVDRKGKFVELMNFFNMMIPMGDIISKDVKDDKYQVLLSNGYDITITMAGDLKLYGKKYDITWDLREDERIGDICYIFSDDNNIILHSMSYDTMTPYNKKVYKDDNNIKNIEDIASYIANDNFAKIIYYHHVEIDNQNYTLLRDTLKKYNIELDHFGNIKYPK